MIGSTTSKQALKDITYAMDIVRALVTDYDLPLTNVNLSPGVRDTRTPHPEPLVVIHEEPAGLLAWAVQLGVEQLNVRRTSGSLTVRVRTTAREVRWHVWGVLYRDGRAEHLPGTAIAWERNDKGRVTNHGSVSRADFQRALAAIGDD